MSRENKKQPRRSASVPWQSVAEKFLDRRIRGGKCFLRHGEEKRVGELPHRKRESVENKHGGDNTADTPT
jgi:hypothetical protein